MTSFSAGSTVLLGYRNILLRLCLWLWEHLCLAISAARKGDKFFTWLFNRTYHNHNEKFEKFGSTGLAIFVGVPLPVTGAWTGCAAAFVFGFKFKNAFLAILAGVIMAGIIVTLLTITGAKILFNQQRSLRFS